MAQNQTLPAAANNGTPVPGLLTQSNVTWSLNDPVGQAQPPEAGKAGTSSSRLPATTRSRAPREQAEPPDCLVDGTTMVASGTSGSPVSGTTYLTAGPAHDHGQGAFRGLPANPR